MKPLLPLALALALALPVGLVAASVDDRYEATASVRINPLVASSEIDRLHAAGGLPRIEDEPGAPFVPGGAGVLQAVAARVGRDPAVGGPPALDDVEVLDTASELVFPKYQEPVRKLKVKVEDEDPKRAALIANRFLDAYLEERQRVLVAGLERAERRLIEPVTPSLRRASEPLRFEAAEAAGLAIELAGNLSVGDLRPASPPDEPLLPHPVRDAIVAGLIGAIVGWLLLRLPSLRRPRRAPLAASP